MTEYLSTLPTFFVWWALGLVQMLAFAGLYAAVTPQRELSLIRGGNVTAATCLVGALLGFVLPVASALAHAVNLVDFALWGVVAAVSQLIVYLLMRVGVRDLTALIEDDRRSVGLLVGAVSLAAGILNAAAMAS